MNAPSPPASVVYAETVSPIPLVQHDCDAGRAWRYVPQKLESLAGQFPVHGGHSREIAAGLAKAGSNTDRHRIRSTGHHNGDGRGGPLRSSRGVRSSRDDEVHLEADELGGNLVDLIVIAMSPAGSKRTFCPST
jgi:hypothetical protein